MKHLKYFESSEINFYKKIGVEEYNDENKKFNKGDLVEFTTSEKSTISELIEDKYKPFYSFDLLYINPNTEKFDISKNILLIKKGFDEWFLIQSNTKIGKTSRIRTDFWLCDQFDGLLKFLEDFGYIKQKS